MNEVRTGISVSRHYGRKPFPGGLHNTWRILLHCAGCWIMGIVAQNIFACFSNIIKCIFHAMLYIYPILNCILSKSVVQ